MDYILVASRLPVIITIDGMMAKTHTKAPKFFICSSLTYSMELIGFLKQRVYFGSRRRFQSLCSQIEIIFTYSRDLDDS